MNNDKLRNAALAGGAAFVFGIAGATYLYFRDKDSMDYVSITHAADGAILHGVLWSIVAGIVFLYMLFTR